MGSEKITNVRMMVDKYINENIRGTARPAEILLSESQFKQFISEVEPIYNELYGSLISSFDSEYENVLYRGIPVCLKK